MQKFIASVQIVSYSKTNDDFCLKQKWNRADSEETYESARFITREEFTNIVHMSDYQREGNIEEAIACFVNDPESDELLHEAPEELVGLKWTRTIEITKEEIK